MIAAYFGLAIWAGIVLAAIVAGTWGERARQIDADIAFMRAIPGEGEAIEP